MVPWGNWSQILRSRPRCGVLRHFAKQVRAFGPPPPPPRGAPPQHPGARLSRPARPRKPAQTAPQSPQPKRLPARPGAPPAHLLPLRRRRRVARPRAQALPARQRRSCCGTPVGAPAVWGMAHAVGGGRPVHSEKSKCESPAGVTCNSQCNCAPAEDLPLAPPLPTAVRGGRQPAAAAAAPRRRAERRAAPPPRRAGPAGHHGRRPTRRGARRTLGARCAASAALGGRANASARPAPCICPPPLRTVRRAPRGRRAAAPPAAAPRCSAHSGPPRCGPPLLRQRLGLGQLQRLDFSAGLTRPDQGPAATRLARPRQRWAGARR